MTWHLPSRTVHGTTRVTIHPISTLSSHMSILSSQGHLPYQYRHLPHSYCNLKVIIRIDTVILSSCGQDDQIISCHSAHNSCCVTGGRARAWCPLIPLEAYLSPSITGGRTKACCPYYIHAEASISLSLCRIHIVHQNTRDR
jgi:hypothetical protein